MPFTVYMLVNPLTKKPFYVGITERDDPELRRLEHIEDLEESVKQRHIAEIKRAGQEPYMVYLDLLNDGPAARDAERHWQEFFYSQGFTLTNGEIVKLNGQMERRSGTRWGDDDFERLKKLYYEKNGSMYEIAKELERTPESVKELLRKMLYTFQITESNTYAIKDELKDMGFKFDKGHGWYRHDLMPKASELMNQLKEKGIKFSMKKP